MAVANSTVVEKVRLVDAFDDAMGKARGMVRVLQTHCLHDSDDEAPIDPEALRWYFVALQDHLREAQAAFAKARTMEAANG